ncbi:MAG: hypothetical protein O3B03_05425 [Proteobacteria bacterium]|nr:hypothetical protein [Pseudomonadota bacterium]
MNQATFIAVFIVLTVIALFMWQRSNIKSLLDNMYEKSGLFAKKYAKQLSIIFYAILIITVLVNFGDLAIGFVFLVIEWIKDFFKSETFKFITYCFIGVIILNWFSRRFDKIEERLNDIEQKL